MNKIESILKQLELDYETLVGGESYSISPKNFMMDIKIILITKSETEFEMFIWDNEEVKHPITFQLEENIPDIYSFLYNYKLKNCEFKTKSIRKSN